MTAASKSHPRSDVSMPTILPYSETSRRSGRRDHQRELAADRARGQPLQVRGRRGRHDLLELLGQLAGHDQRHFAPHLADRFERGHDAGGLFFFKQKTAYEMAVEQARPVLIRDAQGVAEAARYE